MTSFITCPASLESTSRRRAPELLIDLGKQRRAAVELAFDIEAREIAAARFKLHFEIAQRNIGAADDVVDFYGDVGAL